MAKSVYLSIPCEYENKVLIVKSLGLKGTGDSPDEALLDSIKNTALYVPLLLSKFTSFEDFRGRTFMHLEVPFQQVLVKKINEVEPYPEEKKKRNSLIAEPLPEEILNLGYNI